MAVATSSFPIIHSVQFADVELHSAQIKNNIWWPTIFLENINKEKTHTECDVTGGDVASLPGAFMAR